MFAELHDEVRASGAGTVVISHEGMSKPDVRPEVLRTIFRDYDASVIVYARSPADYLEALFRSSVRTDGYGGEVDDYVAGMADRVPTGSMLASWREAFGDGNVRFYSLDAIPRTTTLANHLLESGGAAMETLRPTTRVNERDSNGRLLVRLMANRRARGAGIPPARLRFADVGFDYASNQGRLISDAVLDELGPAIAAYAELLADEGQPPLADRLLSQPYDPGFFDPANRAEADKIAEGVVRQAAAGRPAAAPRKAKGEPGKRQGPKGATPGRAGQLMRRLYMKLRRWGQKAAWLASGAPPVIILMRYSVLQESRGKSSWRISRDAGSGDYRRNLFADERLSLHFRTLTEIVLPSLAAQTLRLDARRHRLIVFTSTELPSHHLAALKQALARHDWATIELVAPTEAIDFAGPTARALRTMGVAEGPYATVRLDDDDALARIFIERLSALVVPGNAGKAVTFPRGYVGILDQATCRFTEFRSESHPFNAQGLAAIGELDKGRLTPAGLETVYGFADHTRIRQRYPYVLDASFPAFIRTIHPQQDTQGVDREGKLAKLPVVAPAEVRDRFGIP